MKKGPFPKYVYHVLYMTLFVLVVFFIRNWVLADDTYAWLMSNLFSGFVPLLAAFVLKLFKKGMSAFLFWAIAFIWLIFYPNSPYMISDLIHVTKYEADKFMVVLFDTLMIYSIALLSLTYGLISIKIMFELLSERIGTGFARSAIFLALVLSCIAFLLGRVPPVLYSHQIFTDPMLVLDTLWNHLFPFGENKWNYILMLLFGGIQLMLLIFTRNLKFISATEEQQMEEAVTTN